MIRRPVFAFPLAALAVAALLAPLAARAAAARPPASFYGIVADVQATDGTLDLGQQTRRMARAGAGTVSFTFDWGAAQATPSSPLDLRPTDRLVSAAARAGLLTVPVLIGVPPWARRQAGRPYSPPASSAAFALWASALVHRYGPKGTLWSEHPELPFRPVRSWQVWNEPAGSDGDVRPSIFWQDDDPWLPVYLDLLRTTHRAIRAVDPGAQVLLAGLEGPSWKTLGRLYAAGARGAFEGVALHPYTADERNVARIVRMSRAVMRRAGDGRVPIVLTEVGWPADDIASVLTPGVAFAQREQAHWLRAVYTAMARDRTSLGVTGVLWYRWVGRDASDADPFDYSGLQHLTPRGTLQAKPALAAFTAVAGGKG